jgi:GNAT superfamily N-acetyltransferase
MELKFRRIRADEGLSLRALRLQALADAPEAFASTLAHEQAFADAVWHERAAASAEGTCQVTIVAEGNGRLIGLATGIAAGGADNPHVLVVGMFIAREARRRGAGVALLEGIIDWARNRRARLELWVTTDNAAAIALYRKLGFRESGRSRPVAHTPARSEMELLRERDGRVP